MENFKMNIFFLVFGFVFSLCCFCFSIFYVKKQGIRLSFIKEELIILGIWIVSCFGLILINYIALYQFRAFMGSY